MAAPAPHGYHGDAEKFTYIQCKQIDGHDGTGVTMPDLRQDFDRYYLKESFDLLPTVGGQAVLVSLTGTNHTYDISAGTLVGTNSLYTTELGIGSHVVIGALTAAAPGIVTAIASATAATLTRLTEITTDPAAGVGNVVSSAVNPNFFLQGTNASNDDVTYAATIAGLQLQTDGGDNDQVILAPNSVSGRSAWNGIGFGTENNVSWEVNLRTDAIATALIWTGLKLTNTPTIATDADQVFFRYDTDVPDTNWQCIDSIGGTDVTTDSGIVVAASTNYNFRIVIDIDRIARFYINDALVHTTAALTDDVNLTPFVGLQSLSGATDILNVGTMCISRKLFE